MARHQYEITVDEDYDDYYVDDSAVNRLKSAVTRRVGRGFDLQGGQAFMGVRGFERLSTSAHYYDGGSSSSLAQRSVEGWNIIILGLNPEVTEEDVRDLCTEYGPVKGLRMSLGHKTGFMIGYAIVEYARPEEAEAAIEAIDDMQHLGRILSAGWAFLRDNGRK